MFRVGFGCIFEAEVWRVGLQDEAQKTRLVGAFLWSDF